MYELNIIGIQKTGQILNMNVKVYCVQQYKRQDKELTHECRSVRQYKIQAKTQT